MPFSPYLHFQGQCEEAFDFYATCFGGIVHKERYGDSDLAEQTAPAWRDKIMHASLTFPRATRGLSGCGA
jgi:PhnB protein